MRETIHTLGWFVRRTTDENTLIDFYRDVVGLPYLRGYGARTAMFWAGEVQSFEVNSGGTKPPEYTDRAQAPCVPIFRCHGIEGTISRLKAAGVRFINDFEREHNRLAYFVDPSGNVTGLQERKRTSPRAEDVEAWRRWDAGETRIPGADAMPPDLQHIGWVVFRVTDVKKVIAFYRDIVGLDLAHDYGDHGGLLSLGDGVLLEISEGCPPQPIARDRSEVSGAPILRVRDVEGMVADLKAKSVHFVNDPFDIQGGRLCYFADPEGHLMGLQQRTSESTRVEDIEAERRWAARTK